MKQLLGTVISTKMSKSAVVYVETSFAHPLYTKLVKRSKKYLVHNELSAQLGDKVVIQETRPLSASKHFTIIKIIKK